MKNYAGEYQPFCQAWLKVSLAERDDIAPGGQAHFLRLRSRKSYFVNPVTMPAMGILISPPRLP